MPFRFVHAADIHLDSPLKSLALRDPELAELIGNATRRALGNIVSLCLAEQVDALLLAGDLYDGEQTSMKTARFLADQIRLLHDAGIRVFIIRGNHDAIAKITTELTLPDSVKIFGGRADAVNVVSRTGDLAICIHGISFAKPHAPESLLPKYRPPMEGAVNIGLMHTSLAGAPGVHDNYAPCNIADLHAAGFNYWGLGHIHARSVVRGRSDVVMSGMPQGRDINEAGAKSVTLVTIADDRSIQIDEHVTSVAQFERVAVDLTGVEQWRDMVHEVERALGATRGGVPSEHLVARLHLTGVTPLAWRLRRDPDVLKGEADNVGFSIGKTWIEKVQIDCHAPVAGGGSTIDTLAELRCLIDQQVAPSLSFRDEIAAIADELRLQLPHECRGFLGADRADFDAICEVLAREGSEDVLARLQTRADAERG